MPIYEYQCVECNARQELLVLSQRRSEPQWCDCGGQMELVPSRPASFTVGKYGKGGGNGKAKTEVA